MKAYSLVLSLIFCTGYPSAGTVTLNELLPPNFVMTSGTVTVTLPLPQQGCDTVMVSGYFTAPGECMDNINTVQLITSANDTLTADTCVTVMFPCWEPGIDMIADSTYSSTLPQVVYTNDTMYLEGLLFVDDDLWLYGCMIYTAPGAHIVVMPGANLTIDSATVIEGCGTMWQGITLRSPYSSVWVDNDSKIKDAECGIYANDTTEFYVFNSEITESVSGITTKADRTGNYRNITGRVEGTKFGMWNSGVFKPSYSGQPPHGSIPRAGIELNNIAGMVIGNYSNNKNQFNRMHSGIVGWGSVYRILNTEFTQLQKDSAYNQTFAGTAVVSYTSPASTHADLRFYSLCGSGFTVNSCVRGVYTELSAGLISEVRMTGVETGVYSTRCGNQLTTLVTGCEIHATKYGINYYMNNGM